MNIYYYVIIKIGYVYTDFWADFIYLAQLHEDYMLSAIKNLDIFLSNYQNILNLLVAIGTVGAVCCSIHYSQLSLKPMIKSYIYIANLNLPNLNGMYVQSEEEYIVLKIYNNGLIPIYLSNFSFFWTFLPFKKCWLQPPLGQFANNNEYELSPHKSIDICLCEVKQFSKILENIMCANKFNKFLLSFIKLKIITSSDACFIVNINRAMINAILDKV